MEHRPPPRDEEVTFIQIEPEDDGEEEEEVSPQQTADVVHDVLSSFDYDQNTEKSKLLQGMGPALPAMLMPHAWVVHTHAHEFIRVGFERADLDREYDSMDLLSEIEQFYRQSMMMHDDSVQIEITPLMPQGVTCSKSVKDFVKHRGWYSVVHTSEDGDGAAASSGGVELAALVSALQRTEEKLMKEALALRAAQEASAAALREESAQLRMRLERLERVVEENKAAGEEMKRFREQMQKVFSASAGLQ